MPPLEYGITLVRGHLLFLPDAVIENVTVVSCGYIEFVSQQKQT